jgi:NAD(P)-dependent dehydrogenase (short-subunit alcohol dehydrogenase family)
VDQLAGRVAFITGAAGGLGRAMAEAFAAQGATVAMADANQALLEQAAAAIPHGRGVPVVCDVSNRAAVKAAIDGVAARHGGLDILVNNAVAFHYAPLADMPEDIVDRMIDVGIKGVFWCMQAATPHLIARGGGHVINLSSVAVSFSITNAAVYSSIKGAIDTLTRQQAVELGPFGIRVNALAPGPVATPGASSVITAQGWIDRTAKTPLKRLATAEQVAAAALFLVSDPASSITGVTLKIDAGITIAGP